MRRLFLIGLVAITSMVVITFALKEKTEIKVLDTPSLSVKIGEELRVNLSDFISGPNGPVNFKIIKGSGKIEGSIYTVSPRGLEDCEDVVEIVVEAGKSEAVITLNIEILNDPKAPSIEIGNRKVYEGETLMINLPDFTSADSSDVTYELVSGVGSIDEGVYSYLPGSTEAPTAHRVTIKAMDGRGEWQCTTFSVIVIDVNNWPGEPANPFPADGTVDFFREVTLLWSAEDPDGDDLFYDVYFGEKGELELLAKNIEENEWTISFLEAGREYFWRIHARDGRGGEVQGPLWSFSTKEIPSIFWKRLLGGSGRDSVNSLKALTDSTFVMTGWTESHELPKWRSEEDVFRSGWVVKLDSNGYLVWQKFLDFGWTEISDIIATEDGGFLLAGRSSTGNGFTSKEPSNLLLVSLDRFANVKWKTELGRTVSSEVSLAKADDGFLVLGTAAGSEEISRGDVLLIKLDLDGRPVWEKKYGGSSYERAIDMAIAGNGDIVIAAETTSKDGDSNGNVSRVLKVNGIEIENSSVLVLRVDGSGGVLWTKVFGGIGEDSPAAVEIGPAGEIFVCGSTNSQSGDFKRKSGDYDGFIIKLDGDGELIWKKIYGGRSNDYLTDIAITGSGGAIVVGFTESDDVTLGSFHEGELDKLGLTYSDMWVFQVSRSGEILWSDCYGGTLGDVAMAISLCDDGFAITGYTASEDGDIPINRGSFDIITLRFK